MLTFALRVAVHLRAKTLSPVPERNSSLWGRDSNDLEQVEKIAKPGGGKQKSAA
jgi:hypothetical protein